LHAHAAAEAIAGVKKAALAKKVNEQTQCLKASKIL
jgi:hypothetical protein